MKRAALIAAAVTVVAYAILVTGGGIHRGPRQ
jgi:hypothetical protein